MYDPLGQVMSDRYRVLALDQRGHGETDWASTYGPDLVFDDVASFIERLGLSRVSIQVAHRALFDVIPRAIRIEFQQFVQDGLVQQSDGRWTWRWDPKLLQARLPPPPDFMWRTLPRVSCRTLYVRGEDSEYVPLELAERMVAVLPRGQLANIPNAGNFSWFENPTAVMDVVREFLVPQ